MTSGYTIGDLGSESGGHHRVLLIKQHPKN